MLTGDKIGAPQVRDSRPDLSSEMVFSLVNHAVEVVCDHVGAVKACSVCEHAVGHIRVKRCRLTCAELDERPACLPVGIAMLIEESVVQCQR